MRLIPISLILAASLFLASCSTVEFAYNYAPDYIAGEFDDAFDVDDAQQEQLDAALERFFAWHRQHELALYRDFLDDSANSIADGIRAEEVLLIVNELRRAWHRTLGRFSEDFAPLLASLSARQVDHYEAYYREKSEYYEQYLAMNAQQRREFRVEEGLENLEEWFGELSGKQREAFGKRLQQLPEFNTDWIAFRNDRHRAFVNALRKAPSEGLTSGQLQHILFGPDSDHTRAFQSVRVNYWQAYARMIEDLSVSLTSMQLEHAVDRLRNYSDGIGNLARND